MDKVIKKLPIPIVGLMLALAALGNLVQSYGEGYRKIFGLMSAIILVLVLIKIIMYPKGVKEALENPVVSSVFPTLTMGIMILATYLNPYAPSFAFGVWIVGLGLHIILMIWFATKQIAKFNIKKVFPSWFIPFVGIAVASVTAPAFEMTSIGKVAFYFALISYLVLLPIVLKRIFVIKEIPEVALPTIAILSAPASLCLAGYMNSFQDKNMLLVWFLLAASQITYLLVLLYLPKMLKLKFYPSFSGFTFPLVISALSLKLTNGFFIKTERPIAILKTLVKFEELVAVFIVLYVLFLYITFIFGKDKATKVS